ncbi:MAG: hydrolase [Cyclobacteriaceae bacterium]|nr:MAG: hydrolase [Cyclobacteriaceae bacterium]
MNCLQKYTNDDSRFLVIDGSLVHYRVEGAGEPLLLIHGAFSSLHTFDKWSKALSGSHQIIRLDLPGFGLSDSMDGYDYSIKALVKFMTRFMDQLGIQKCSIAGSSLGGWLAWEMAISKPDRVEKLVLISSAGFMEEQNIPLPFKMARTPVLGKVMKYAIKKNVLRKFLNQVFVDQKQVTDELVDRYYDLISRAGNPEAFHALANGKYKSRSNKLKDITAPTLIMWGEEDAWVPIENGYWFQVCIPNSQLIVYEGVGHIPMEEIPERTARDLRKFLKS